jgi:hypothetical protein
MGIGLILYKIALLSRSVNGRLAFSIPPGDRRPIGIKPGWGGNAGLPVIESGAAQLLLDFQQTIVLGDALAA